VGKKDLKEGRRRKMKETIRKMTGVKGAHVRTPSRVKD